MHLAAHHLTCQEMVKVYTH